MKCTKCGAEGSGAYCSHCGEPLHPYTANTEGLFVIFMGIMAFFLLAAAASGSASQAFIFTCYTLIEGLATLVAAKQWRRGRWYLEVAGFLFGVIGYILIKRTFTKRVIPQTSVNPQGSAETAPRANPTAQRTLTPPRFP